MSNHHVCCAVGGTGTPLAAPEQAAVLSQRCDKATQSLTAGCSHGYRAASIRASISAQLQAGTGTNATFLGAAYTTRSSALR